MENFSEPSEQDLERFKEKFVGKVYQEDGGVSSTKPTNGKQIFTDADFAEQELVRVIRPGQMVTYDYCVNRLNIMLDENDVCTSVNFG